MELPAWACKDEAYRPTRDRDAFLSRSFLRVMQALAALRLSGARALRWSPQGLLALLFCWVLLTALAAGLPVPGCQLALLLAALMFCDGRCLRRVLGAALAAAVFSLLLAAPAVFWGAGRALLPAVAPHGAQLERREQRPRLLAEQEDGPQRRIEQEDHRLRHAQRR